MSEYSFASEHKDDMRGVFLRLYCENHLSDGTITNYTEEDIKNFVKRYWDGNSEIGYILHDKDIDADSVLKKPHYHIAMWRTVRGNYHFDAIVKALPGVHVEQMKKKEESFAYLIHATFPNKHQYDVSEVKLNFPVEQYEEYVSVAVERYKQKEAKHSENVAKRDANKNMRNEMLADKYAEHQQKKEMDKLLEQMLAEILSGKITRRNLNDMIIDNPHSILTKTFNAHPTKFERAFKMRADWMGDHYKRRDLHVVFIEGNGGGGKTDLSTYICEANKWRYSVSSAENDIFENVKEDDDCFIFNETVEPGKYRDFLRWLDTYFNPTLGSRYHGKQFFGHTVIITTPKTIDEWYSKEGVADGDYDGESTRVQFDRRIHTLIKVKSKYIEEYIHHDDGTNTLLKRYHNPIYSLKEKNKREGKIKRMNGIGLQDILDYSAKDHDIVSDYEDFKNNTPVDELASFDSGLNTMKGKPVNEDAISLIFEKAIEEYAKLGISRVEAIKYLISRLKFYTEPGLPDAPYIKLGGK